MCLSLAESMLPTSKYGWMAHLKGVGKILQLCGPDNYSTGVSYRLFLGIRHLLIFEAFQSRTSTFLEEEDWQTVPFSNYPALPLQSLLNHAALIPSLLETFDILTKSSLTPPLPEIQDLSSRLTSVLSLLDEWEHSYRQGIEDPPYWPTTPTSYLSFPQDEMREAGAFTFPNIFTANAFTHLWALRIICLFPIKGLQRLQEHHSHLSSLSLPPLSAALHISPSSQHWQIIIHLSLRICKSMAYLMQDAGRLYGPISTLFPLKVAYKTFNLAPSTHKAQIIYCQIIVDRLVFKGMDLASLL
ncbi:hypothetical protein N431DRAFT_429902 [Stipitochalara longipes BDJ]|nr:hypothetical protein N431DRAFT_429902 [Stipitochalara longipes BDJ]